MSDRLFPTALSALADDIKEIFTCRHLTLSTAESCTGGLIGGLLTALPGSSGYYLGGVISYANAVKEGLLGVPGTVLETVGAVSEETAIAMAKGAQSALHSDYALSVTGIAGPGGGSEKKPVGTVWIGLATPDGVTARRFLFSGDREEVRLATVGAALTWLRDEMN